MGAKSIAIETLQLDLALHRCPTFLPNKVRFRKLQWTIKLNLLVPKTQSNNIDPHRSQIQRLWLIWIHL